jgi:hypothetical protein
MSAVPSSDALSTTTTSCSTPPVVSPIERRQSRAASRHW